MRVQVSVTVHLDEGERFEADVYGGKARNERFEVQMLSASDRDKERKDIYASGVRLTKKGTPYKGGQSARAWGWLPLADLPSAVLDALLASGVVVRKD